LFVIVQHRPKYQQVVINDSLMYQVRCTIMYIYSRGGITGWDSRT